MFGLLHLVFWLRKRNGDISEPVNALGYRAGKRGGNGKLREKTAKLLCFFEDVYELCEKQLLRKSGNTFAD